jgi:hypothetical protein
MGKDLHLNTIIVIMVIFNENEELLMIQESKEDCYGKYYLPAGIYQSIK